MPSWLCKIWTFITDILGKIIDFALEQLKKVVALVVEAIDALADSLFGGSGLLWLLAAAAVGYFILTSDGEKEDPAPRDSPLPETT